MHEDDDYDAQRGGMIRLLQRRGITDQRVLAVMRELPRERFVPSELRDEAYGDHPVPIGYGATLSQPYMAAFMSEAAHVATGDRVLEVGTGSGYQAALLSRLGAEVYSVDIESAHTEAARTLLGELGLAGVHLRSADGYQGWAEAAPFDAIIVTAASRRVPEPLLDQLAEDGRLIIPVGERGEAQTLEIHRRRGEGVVVSRVFPVRFIPMRGEAESSLH